MAIMCTAAKLLRWPGISWAPDDGSITKTLAKLGSKQDADYV